ncbi:MAG TPA: CoA ester lyase [Burkholderiales bacterium]|nr:CoA ester lyase [Burkholderiales bacterium]
MKPSRRPPALRRSWLFVGGDDAAAHRAACDLGADVVIQELEDSTPPERRPAARALAADAYTAWRQAGLLSAVRINPLETDGLADLAAVIPARPDIVLMSKVAEPVQVQRLADEVERLEREHGLPAGAIELVPNIESARGIMQTYAIAKASARVTGIAGSTEDTAADLGAIRGKDGAELAYVRQRLHVESVAAGVVSIDCPYTFADIEGCETDARYARRLGYHAKLINDPSHVAVVNKAMTPSEQEVREAQEIIAAFDTSSRGLGNEQARLNGRLLELPIFLNAQRLLERASALGVKTG